MSDPPAGRAEFLDLDFDTLALAEVIGWVARRTAEDRFAYVVTPNVDHMVRLPSLAAAPRRAYASADLCLCDSRILARLARACGVALPVVPGSDLTAALLGGGLPGGAAVLLVGGEAAHGPLLRARYPALAIVQHVPPMGLLRDAPARAAIVEAAAAAGARVILLAVGSPQQELIAHEMRASGRVRGTALCIGASVDFLVGRERRAPRAIQRAGLEWAWRLSRDPKRLARRYLRDDPAIFAMAWGWARRRRKRV